jgi:predicted kinase
MQMILFSGPQAGGKSTLFKTRFVDTHIRINLDMLRTRHRERLLVAACLSARQPFVVDNTNLTVTVRAGFIAAARAARFRVVGYRFHVTLDVALARNAQRTRPVPEKAVRAACRNWQLPDWVEGFDALFDVTGDRGEFSVEEVDRAQE